MIDDILKRSAPDLARLLRRSVRDLVLVTTVSISGAIGCGGDRTMVEYGPAPVQDASIQDGGTRGDGAPARDAWFDTLLDALDSGPGPMYGPVAYGPPPPRDAAQEDGPVVAYGPVAYGPLPMPDAGMDAKPGDVGPMPAYGPVAYGPPILGPGDQSPTGWYGK